MDMETIEETHEGKKIKIYVPSRQYLYALARIAQGKKEELLSEFEWEYVE